MSLRSLEAWWPEQPAQQLRNMIVRRERHLKRSIRRTRRNVMATLRRQYYLTNALSDSRLALRQNEDIGLACLIIIAVLSFSATSIIDNIIYDFMLAASALSTVLSANLVILVALAASALAVSFAWLMGFLQNCLSIALMEGANRKQKRSLRLTLRKSLRNTPRTVMAWFGLLITTVAPASLALLITALVLYIAHVKLVTGLIYLAVVGVISLTWMLLVLANYSLVPYIMLFEAPANWQAAMIRSRQLVKTKGRLFIIGGYLALALATTGLYYFVQLIHNLSILSSLMPSLFLSLLVISVDNACLTMLYRKRKLARK